MFKYRNLMFCYANILFFSTSSISAQQIARPLIEVTQDTQQQQFTGTRNAPAPQQAKKATAQPAAIDQISIPQQQNRFGGSREKAALIERPVIASPAQTQQFTGNRTGNTPSKVAKIKERPQKVAETNISTKTTQPVSVFGGNRQIAQPQAAVVVAPANKNISANLHPFNSNRQMTVNTLVARQRPIVVQTAMPQTIVINQRSNICPYVTLSPFAIAKKGNYIELNDGSVWKVRHRDRSKVKKWSANDAIVIETGKFFSWYAYSLVNYSRNESIDVELHLSDNCNGSTSHWIVEVNPYQGYVRLENGSIWRMSTSELAAWSQNDDVIIGLSRDWFSSQYNYVLINPKAKSRFTATLEF